LQLEKKSVVVTGASAGMGRAIVELFAQEGANVIAVARRQALLEELAASLEDAPGKVIPFAGDTSLKETNEAMIDKAIKEFGRFDVLINNAGIMDDNTAIADMTDEMLDRVMKVNTFGPMYAMRKAVQVFLEQGDGGNIINVGSIGAIHNAAGVAYCASKAALTRVAQSTAYMYQEEEIRCNTIAPGAVASDIAMAMPESNEFGKSRTDKVVDLVPSMGMPEDIAAVALFLASDASSFINGVMLPVDGGWLSF